MEVKRVEAKIVLDSRSEKTIQVCVSAGFLGLKKFITSAPSGKSTGKYEKNPYVKSIKHDVDFINKFYIEKINNLKIQKFDDLKKLEFFLKDKIGANSLFAIEASILKAVAYENKKPLWKFLNSDKKIKIPRIVGNTIGGGLHSKGNKKPDFQEFLFIPETGKISEDIKLNKKAYLLVYNKLKEKNSNISRNDEGALNTELTNDEVLELMYEVKKIIESSKDKIDIGIDAASSSFYKNGNYIYKNPEIKLNSKKQINYIHELQRKFKLFYIEDPLNENDFSGMKQLLKKNLNNFLIVGDDLTTTNLIRLKKAISKKSINGIIVKPNQIGSLIEVKEVIELAKKNNIKTIISHRSGETLDNTISDLAVAWNCDFIKCGIYGNVREAKLKRLLEIEREMKN